MREIKDRIRQEIVMIFLPDTFLICPNVGDCMFPTLNTLGWDISSPSSGIKSIIERRHKEVICIRQVNMYEIRSDILAHKLKNEQAKQILHLISICGLQ